LVEDFTVSIALISVLFQQGHRLEEMRGSTRGNCPTLKRLREQDKKDRELRVFAILLSRM
jgi:hypothetical protein